MVKESFSTDCVAQSLSIPLTVRLLKDISKPTNITLLRLFSPSQFSNKKFVDTILKELIGSSGNDVNQEKMERTFLTVTNLEEFIGNYAQNHLNQTVPKMKISSEHAGKWILKADLEVSS